MSVLVGRSARCGVVAACFLPVLAACAGNQRSAGPTPLQTAPVASVSSEQLAPPAGVAQSSAAGQIQQPGQPVYQQQGVQGAAQANAWQNPQQAQAQNQVPGQTQGQTLNAQQAQLQQQTQNFNQAQGQFQSQVATQVQPQVQQAAAGAPPTQQELLGQWTIADNTVQCQLNVSLTGWQGGYRASTRNCHGSELKNVGAWNIAGSQVILKDQQGTQIAVLQRTANRRFDGALSAGGPVAMLR